MHGAIYNAVLCCAQARCIICRVYVCVIRMHNILRNVYIAISIALYFFKQEFSVKGLNIL